MRNHTSVIATVIASIAVPFLMHCDAASSPASTAPEVGPDAAVVSTCAERSGAGTSHGGDAVTTDTVWTAAAGPHHVTFGFTIEAAAKLTIEPCARVVFDGGYGVTVKGKLVAEGTPSTPITFEAADATKPWSGLLVALDSAGTISLANATLSDGGNTDDPNITAMIDARGDGDGAPTERLKVVDVTVKGSRQYGVVLRDGATFTSDSSNLVVSGAKLFPVRADARLTTNLPSGVYTGNTNDEILLDLSRDVSNDTTLRERGVPYRLGGTEGVNAGSNMAIGISGPTAQSATLTIEAGVKVRASLSSSIQLRKDATQKAVGKLVVKGTASAPVVFTSAAAAPKAGDWRGIVFDAPDATNAIDHAVIEYAGGPTQANSAHCDPQSTTGGFSPNEDAAIALFGQPASAFVTNTTISKSAGDGIGRSWSGELVDFLPTNTFEQVATCKQSYPRAASGACPVGSVPCP
jgi:hypothetical protein